MIRMIKGTYGLVANNGAVIAMTPRSGPFEVNSEREAELVAIGVAEYAKKPTRPTRAKRKNAKEPEG